MPIKKVSLRDAIGLLGLGGAALSPGCGSESSASPTATTGNTTTGARRPAAPAPRIADGDHRARPDPPQLRPERHPGRQERACPLTLTITVVNATNACSPVANAAVDIWQCDAQGNYSQYAQPGYNGTAQTFLRGIQTTDASGRATFNTIYPGLVPGPGHPHPHRGHDARPAR